MDHTDPSVERNNPFLCVGGRVSGELAVLVERGFLVGGSRERWGFEKCLESLKISARISLIVAAVAVLAAPECVTSIHFKLTKSVN